MKKVINNVDHYLVPGTDYYISTHGAVYSAKRQSYIAREGNTIRLSIGGIRGRYNCDKLLIDALLAHIDDIKGSI